MTRLLQRIASLPSFGRSDPFQRAYRSLAIGLEPLEDRLLMTVDPASAALDVDNQTQVISSIWFEQLSSSAVSASNNGGLSIEESIGKIQWNEGLIDTYTNEWIVQLDWDAASGLGSISEATSLFATGVVDFEIIGGLGLGGQLLIRTSDATSEVVDQWLSENEWATYYEPNAVLPVEQVPNDSSYSQLWGLNNTGQTGGTADADIDAPEAWEISTGSSSVVVAIIDTGVDYTHPDLAANIWTNPGEIAGNGIDDDGNGFIDDIHGYDFVNNDGDPMDDHSHGTHVAGTIAGDGNNGTGVTGVNWNSSIMALKFLSGSGSGSTADAVRAVNYATMMKTSYGVNVAVTNNSWGGGGYSQAMYNAIAASGNADILFIAAAGNSGSNNDAGSHYPSSYNLSNVISVAATDHNDNLAYFSSYGANSVDLAAPGVGIYSTVPGNRYATFSGTSMATPHVSGVAALAWSVSPNATAAQIKAAILSNVDPLASLNGVVATGGRLNAHATLASLGMNVSGASIAEGGTVASPSNSFTIDFSTTYDSASIDAADLKVNGIGADGYTLIDANTVTFTFNSSPVTVEGVQSMQIAAGSIQRAGGGDGINAWQRSFSYDAVALSVVSASPSNGAVLATAPAYIDLDFNEAVDAASVGVGDLTLSIGTVTAAGLLDADTVRYTIDVPVTEGTVTYVLQNGAINDSFGNAGLSYSGTFVVDDPSISRFGSSNVNLQLADSGTVYSTITVADGGSIIDLDVELTITHTWDSDLDVYLIAPDGTSIELFTDVGGSGDNFTYTILDDEAGTQIRYGQAPFAGRYRPEGLLSALDGKGTAGTWTLAITDDFANDTGVLKSWAIIVEANLAPTMPTLSDRSMLHTAGPLTVALGGTDADGDSITYTAQIDTSTANQAHSLDQQLGLFATDLQVANNYFENHRGLGEKYLRGAGNSYYYILPSGQLYHWGGSIAASTLVATLDSSYHADPTRLYDAQAANSSAATFSIDQANGQLTITPAGGYVGSFGVSVTASDGRNSTQQTFNVSVTNSPAVLAPIADQQMSYRNDTLQIPLTVTNPDGDALTYSVTATDISSNPAYDLDQQVGLFATSHQVSNNYFENYRGLGEKYLSGAGGSYYYILPSGQVYHWGGSISASTLVATLDSSYHADPTKLYNAQSSNATIAATISGSTLTIDPPAGFVGDIQVAVTISDGIASDTESFRVRVANLAPTMPTLSDRTMLHTDGPLTVALGGTDADGDSITYMAQIDTSTANQAHSLDQQLGLFATDLQVANNYFENHRGLGEKYLRGAGNSYYYILPSGQLYHWGGSIAASTLVATLDSSYHADPTRLYDAQAANSSAATFSIDQANGQLTITPAGGYVGSFGVSVTASDGRNSTQQTFNVSVTNSPAVLAPIADQQMSYRNDTLQIPLTVTNPDGDALTYSVTATDISSNPAYDLDQQVGLFATSHQVSNNYFENYRGLGEKYLSGAGGSYYYILPSGQVYHWGGSISASTLVASLDSSYHADPTKLYNAQSSNATIAATISGSTLTIDPPAGFTGDIQVAVTISDGIASDTESFRVHVANLAPTMPTLSDQTMLHTDGPLTVALGGTDADGDSITYSAQIDTSTASQAQSLDQQLGLFATDLQVANNYFENHRGLGEKYLRGAGNSYYYILPSGQLYHWGGSISASTLVATLDSSYHADPTRLYEAQAANSSAATFSIDQANGQLTITPAGGYVGSFGVSVTASDGRNSTQQTFNVTVSAAGASMTASNDDSGRSEEATKSRLTSSDSGGQEAWSDTIDVHQLAASEGLTSYFAGNRWDTVATVSQGMFTGLASLAHQQRTTVAASEADRLFGGNRMGPKDFSATAAPVGAHGLSAADSSQGRLNGAPAQASRGPSDLNSVSSSLHEGIAVSTLEELETMQSDLLALGSSDWASDDDRNVTQAIDNAMDVFDGPLWLALLEETPSS